MVKALMAVAIALLASCARQPAATPQRESPRVQPSATPAAVPDRPAASGASPSQNPASERAATGPGRRRSPPAVIGGCGANCSTPEAAVSYFLVQLRAPDRVAGLRPMVEWSTLEVDGQALGARWEQLWSDPAQHDRRKEEIDAWLQSWSAWPDRAVSPQGWAEMRGSGLQLRMSGPDLATVRLRHPQLTGDGGDPVWVLQWRKRGDEWLLTSIAHRGTAPGGP